MPIDARSQQSRETRHKYAPDARIGRVHEHTPSSSRRRRPETYPEKGPCPGYSPPEKCPCFSHPQREQRRMIGANSGMMARISASFALDGVLRPDVHENTVAHETPSRRASSIWGIPFRRRTSLRCPPVPITTLYTMRQGCQLLTSRCQHAFLGDRKTRRLLT